MTDQRLPEHAVAIVELAEAIAAERSLTLDEAAAVIERTSRSLASNRAEAVIPAAPAVIPIIHTPCLRCKGPREHYGIGRCYACMTPAERDRYAHQTT